MLKRSHRFCVHYHDTLIDIIYGEEKFNVKSRFGKSLFRDIDGMERNCQKYEELTENDLCRCIKN